jgi:hypothetical protein
VHRTPLLLLSVLTVSLLAFAPATSDGDLSSSASCRVDGAVAYSNAIGQVTCADVNGGEFEVDVTVTLQRLTSAGWKIVASERCTGDSTNGQASVPCEVVTPTFSSGPHRALIDVASPQDLAPVEFRPTNQGPVRPDALADDECGVNEAFDNRDTALADAPWADVCAITMTHQLDKVGGDVRLSSVEISVHVAGMLEHRTPTTSWHASLETESCVHSFEAAGDGVTDVRVLSECNPVPSTPCEGDRGTIFGDNCVEDNGYTDSETKTFTASQVAFTDTEIRITLDIDDLGSLAANDLVAGATVISVMGGSRTSVRRTGNLSRTAVGTEFAYSNGRSYTFD